MEESVEEERAPIWFNVIALLIWATAGVVAFLPIALDTSPWDVVRFRVPGNEGNWWHFLIGAPFFFAFPMTWLRLRSLLSTRPSTRAGRRVIWILVALLICGTISVTVPFLLRLGNLAKLNEWRRLSILCPALGIIIASGVFLYFRRRELLPTRACLVGINTAYLANAAFCVIIYRPMPGTIRSKLGLMVTAVIVWPMLLELLWIFVQSFRRRRVLPEGSSEIVC